MKVVHLKPSHKDDRGLITDILDRTRVECVTFLSSRKGSVRGNHYHKKTTQYAYVLGGRFRLYTQQPGRKMQTKVLRAGDLVITPPLERHAFVALEDSTMIACAHGLRVGRDYECDTFRLTQPLAPGPRR